MQIRFDHGPDQGENAGEGLHFADPLRLIRADCADQVPQALAALAAAQQAGHWLAGYATYELGYALEPCLAERMPKERRLPLLCFGVYEDPVPQKAEGSARPRGGEKRPPGGRTCATRPINRVKWDWENWCRAGPISATPRLSRR